MSDSTFGLTVEQPAWEDLPVEGERRRRARARVPALTILYHPDLSRVGERALLSGLPEGRTAYLSRLEPGFESAERSDPLPLEDRHISRAPLRLSRNKETGALQISIAESRTRLTANGAPVQESWTEMGVTMHWHTTLTAFLDDGTGQVRGVSTSDGEIPAELVVVATHKVPNNALAVAAGLTTGSTGGLVIDDHMRTSAAGVWAAGDVCEVPHGLGGLPLQGLTGSHAYAQGKVAGTNAAGGDRAYQPVYVPWGMVAGKWMIGGAAFGEVAATALGIPHVVGRATGISRARYYPGVKQVRVKLLAETGSLRLIGAQLVGGEGIKERADFLAVAVRKGLTLHDLATMENVYSPPIGALNEPIVVAAQDGLAAAAKGA